MNLCFLIIGAWRWFARCTDGRLLELKALWQAWGSSGPANITGLSSPITLTTGHDGQGWWELESNNILWSTGFPSQPYAMQGKLRPVMQLVPDLGTQVQDPINEHLENSKWSDQWKTGPASAPEPSVLPGMAVPGCLVCLYFVPKVWRLLLLHLLLLHLLL